MHGGSLAVTTLRPAYFLRPKSKQTDAGVGGGQWARSICGTARWRQPGVIESLPFGQSASRNARSSW